LQDGPSLRCKSMAPPPHPPAPPARHKGNLKRKKKERRRRWTPCAVKVAIAAKALALLFPRLGFCAFQGGVVPEFPSYDAPTLCFTQASRSLGERSHQPLGPTEGSSWYEESTWGGGGRFCPDLEFERRGQTWAGQVSIGAQGKSSLTIRVAKRGQARCPLAHEVNRL
jgi:hypothetical protein